LRPRPFPDETASLLPGLLAATRTGLPPASDDELTNTKKHHGTTSRCHLLLCWAHERSRLTFAIRIECTTCGHLMLFNAEKYRTGEEPILEREPAEEEDRSSSRSGW